VVCVFCRPPGMLHMQDAHPERVRGILAPLSGCGFRCTCNIPGVRKQRVPLTNFLCSGVLKSRPSSGLD
jgi:hypothetical protein